MIRVLAAVAALAAAAILIAIAVDVGRWEASGSRHPATLAGGAAERLLGTSDDVALRRAVLAFVAAERTPYGFDNGLQQARVRALAEAQLAGLAATASPRQASQANDLIGILAWGGTNAPSGVVDPADRAVAAFTTAARLDPSNTAATFNLELALRALQAHGVRQGSNPQGGPRGSGHSGAGSGTAGQGY